MTDTMLTQNDHNETLARRLEATGEYRVLRRLLPRQPRPGANEGKVGIIIDLETTGLDPAKDEIIEVAVLKFAYSNCDEVTGIIGVFQAFNQPAAPIPADIVELTGLTDEMVAGRQIDAAALEAFAADANIVIAHNAGFDRKFAERSWDIFRHKAWACSATGIEWKRHGFAGANLVYLLMQSGFFHGAHRALDDCHATLAILAQDLPGASTTALVELLQRARRKTFCVWAAHAPLEFKERLKRRRYRWNDGTDGRPRSWYIEVDEFDVAAELKYLRTEIYQSDVEIEYREITALDRFSNRV